MEPRLVDMGEMTIVGVEESGADIGPLWARFEAGADRIASRIEEVGYELHWHPSAEGGCEGANVAMSAWLESGPYKLRENLSIQRYDSRFKGGSAPDSEIDFLLPIVPKHQGAS